MNKAICMIIMPSVLAMMAGCSTADKSVGRGATAAGGGDAPIGAQVAVFNELFKSNASGQQDKAGSYCVSTGPDIDGKVINPDVLAALRGNPKVKSIASCEIAEGGNGVFDRETRKPALLFNVHTASCVSNSECLLFGGYYEGNLSSQTNRYRARLVSGVWTVTLDEMGPVS